MLVCLLGAFVTKTFTVLFSTFWLLFITSFIGTSISDENQAKNIYTLVMLISVFLGVITMPVVGMFADRVMPAFTLPIAFLVRAVACTMFMFIESPNGWYSYVTAVFLVVGTVFENVTVDAVLMRNTDREIRGLVFGCAIAIGMFGQLVFSIAAGFAYDEISVYSPFALCGMLDLSFGLTMIVCGLCGCLKDDISMREAKRRIGDTQRAL